MKKVALIALLLTLSACASVSTKVPERLPPANLIERCRDLPAIDGNTLASLVENHIEVATLYKECQARQKALSEWATKK